MKRSRRAFLAATAGAIRTAGLSSCRPEPERSFCFWLGSTDPRRPYELGSGQRSGEDPNRVVVPPHLPDHLIIRNDILDCYIEVERFDDSVAQALALLEETGQAGNTAVVVTSGHGMPFPRAKASLYCGRTTNKYWAVADPASQSL